MKQKVFISYTHADKKMAESFAEEINGIGMSAFLDKEEIATDGIWTEVIKKEIQDAASFVAIISPSYIKSPWNMQELGAALASGKKIVPVLIDEAKVPFDISKYKFVDGSKMQDAEVRKRLLEAVAA